MNQDQVIILGCRVDILNTAQCLDKITELVDARKTAHVITLNAEIVYQAQTNRELLGIINEAAVVTPDGIGIVWGGRQLGYVIPERVSGIDLLYSICETAPTRKWKIYLLGSSPGVADEAGGQLKARFPGLHICGSHHGYFQPSEVASIIADINHSQADILVVSLGAPKQEIWISQNKDDLAVPVCIGVGGSLDVIAGNKKRAPGWMIRMNLEWLYRLLAEPSRWRRQLALPKFVLLILQSKYRRVSIPD
ncbi:MAG: WecB/TagA/CpsF family glycosyltransferase [Syntrophomonadaceae bacterium]